MTTKKKAVTPAKTVKKKPQAATAPSAIKQRKTAAAPVAPAKTRRPAASKAPKAPVVKAAPASEEPTTAKAYAPDPSRRSRPMLPPPAPPEPGTVISITDLRRVGEALYGLQWKGDMARETGYSKSYLTYILKGARVMPPDMGQRLHEAVLRKLEMLVDKLAVQGMPLSNPQSHKQVREMVMMAVIYASGAEKDEPPKIASKVAA